MERKKYTGMVLVGGGLNRRNLRELVDGVIFNGGYINESAENIVLGIPVGSTIGRVRLRNGIVPIQISSDSYGVTISYKPKPRARSTIYDAVIDELVDMVDRKRMTKLDEENIRVAMM